MAPTTRSPATRSSAALHEAALELIAESGLDGLTLVAVAERAGVSRATAYREFTDKNGLIDAIGGAEVAKLVAAAFGEIDLSVPTPDLVAAVTVFALSYLREHRAFGYLRRHEPAWLLEVAVTHGGSRLDLVQTVAALAGPVLASRDSGDLALPPVAAAEVVVRIVLSHILIERSHLTDEQIAETAIRAVCRTPA